MKYYSISSTSKLKSTNEIVGSGGFLIMVESEEDVKSIIKYEKESQDLNGLYYEDEFVYNEVTVEDYIRYQELAVLRHAKSYYFDTLEIDKTLNVKEYNKIKYTKENEAKALDYYFSLVSAFNVVKKESDLNNISAKDFLNKINEIVLNQKA